MFDRINEISFTNRIYQNASIGKDSISYLLYSKITDDSIRSDMRKQYIQYDNIAAKAAGLLANANSAPQDKDATGSISLWDTVNPYILKDNSADYIAEMIIQGSVTGIIDTVRLQNQYSEISSDAKSLSEEFISAEESNIQKMKEYLH